MENQEMENLRNKLKSYLELNEEDKFNELGKISPEYYSTMGAKPLSKNKIIEFGKKWFEILKVEIQPIICSNKDILILADRSKDIEELHLGVSIISLLIPTFGHVHTPIIVSIIITRGINFFCEDYLK